MASIVDSGEEIVAESGRWASSFPNGEFNTSEAKGVSRMAGNAMLDQALACKVSSCGLDYLRSNSMKLTFSQRTRSLLVSRDARLLRFPFAGMNLAFSQ